MGFLSSTEELPSLARDFLLSTALFSNPSPPGPYGLLPGGSDCADQLSPSLPGLALSSVQLGLC